MALVSLLALALLISTDGGLPRASPGVLAICATVQIPSAGVTSGGPTSMVPAGGPDDDGPSLAGQLIQGSVRSAALERALPYLVYLPPGYGGSDHHYPTLYMLHGINGSYETWAALGLVAAADALVVEGRIQPLILVMPEGDRGYWLNHADGGPRWGDYLVGEVVRLVDSSYRTIPARESRAIGGNSMGGHGALQTAMNHPDLFAVVGAHSPALRRYSETFSFFGDADYFARHDPLTLARTSEALARLTIWIDSGDEDPWRARAVELHDVLASRGIQHEWHVWPGRHDRTYWRAHVDDYLRFYAGALKRDG